MGVEEHVSTGWVGSRKLGVKQEGTRRPRETFTVKRWLSSHLSGQAQEKGREDGGPGKQAWLVIWFGSNSLLA